MAPPSKWDEEEDQSPVPVFVAPRRKFEDEEDSDDVLDSWDAAEDSEVEREKEAKAAAAKAKAEEEAAALKKSKAARIKEHMERRKAQQDEEEDDSDYEDEDEHTRRERLKATEKEADLAHAADLLGDIDLNQKRAARKTAVISDAADPTKSIDLSEIALFRPATKQQFADLTKALIPLLTAQTKKPQYALWVQDFARQLVKDMSSTDIKKVTSVLTTAGNEKLKEEKAADKGGKKSKAAKSKVSLAGARQATGQDLTAYDDVDDLGDDDFM